MTCRPPLLRPAARGGAVALALLLLGGTAHGKLVEGVVAAVDNQVVTFSEVRRGVADALGVDAGEADEVLREERDPERVRAWIAPLVDALLVRKELAKAGQAVAEAEVDRLVQSVQKQNRLDEAAFRKALEGEGMTLEAYRARLRWQLERSALLRARKGKEVLVTEEEAREWYRQQGSLYAEGGEARLALLILPFSEGDEQERYLAAHQAARAATALLAEGKKLPEVAAVLSGRFAGVRLVTGDFVAEEELPEEVRREVRRLHPGEVSPPFFTEDGGRLVQLLERRGGTVPDFASMKGQVIDELTDRRSEKAFKEAMEALRREAVVEYRY